MAITGRESEKSTMEPDPVVSQCLECKAHIKTQLDLDRDLSFTELTESDIRDGQYYFCPTCQIAWDIDERIAYDFPTMSSGPSGMVSEVTAGKAIIDGKTSNYRHLGYNDDGKVMLRDVGDLDFSRDNSVGPPDFSKLEDQLGDVIAVEATGYPNTIQHVLNAIRPGYCLYATIGESQSSGELEVAADNSCKIVEAVPVEYAVETDYIPEFADTVWSCCKVL